jgi:hypothetical protein
MARAINVKVPTIKIIAALEKKLKELLDAKNTYHTRRAQYDKDLKIWNAQVFALVEGEPIEVSVGGHYSHRSASNQFHEVTVRYLVAKSQALPDQPDCPSASGYQEREAINGIENALRILNLTEEEQVNASVYAAISQYL